MTQQNHVISGRSHKEKNENYVSPYDLPARDAHESISVSEAPVKDEIASVVSESLSSKPSYGIPTSEPPVYDKQGKHMPDRYEHRQVGVIIDELELFETPKKHVPADSPTEQVQYPRSATSEPVKQAKEPDYEIVSPKDPKKGKRVDEENSGFLKRAKKGLKGLRGRGKD